MEITPLACQCVMTTYKMVGRIVYRVCSWISEKGYNHDYDLSIADEIFAIFAGVMLFVSYTEKWLESEFEVISAILVSVALTVVTIVVAINQRKFWSRAACYLIAVLLAYGGVEAVMYVSERDLIPQIRALNALPTGVLVWLSIREVSVFAINLLRGRSSDEDWASLQ